MDGCGMIAVPRMNLWDRRVVFHQRNAAFAAESAGRDYRLNGGQTGRLCARSFAPSERTTATPPPSPPPHSSTRGLVAPGMAHAEAQDTHPGRDFGFGRGAHGSWLRLCGPIPPSAAS